MLRRAGRVTTPAALAILLLVIAGGVGVGLAVLATSRQVYTDAESIRVPAGEAPIRDVLWQPSRQVEDWPDPGVDEYEPRLSPDGQTMLLVRGRPGEQADISIARRDDGVWSDPEPLGALNSAFDDLGPSFGPDGETIYFYSDREGGLGGYDLWRSQRDARGRWGAPENLGEAVNTAFNEYGPAVSPDGGTLYFSSNRPNEKADDGLGADRWSATIREDRETRDYDLYSAAIAADMVGDASPLTDLNTRWNEGAPAVSPPGDFLYFSSDRAGGAGGFDIYRSRIVRGERRAPERLDDTVNSPANDLDPSLSMGGYELHFSSDRAPEADGGETKRYRVYVSRSREVFTETDRADAGIDWDALLGPLLWLLLLLLLLLLALLLARQAKEDARWRRLSLLAKCLLASLLIHALLLYLLAFWQVAASIGEALRRPGGRQVIIASSAGSEPLRSQVRGGLTQLTMQAQNRTGEETPEFRRLLDATTQTASLDAAPAPAAEMQRLADATADDATPPTITRPTEIRPRTPETATQEFDSPNEVRVAQATEAEVAAEASEATTDASPHSASAAETAQAAIDPSAAPAETPERVAEASSSDAPLTEPSPTEATIDAPAPSASVAVARPDAPEAQTALEREVALAANDATSAATPQIETEQSSRPVDVTTEAASSAAPAPVTTVLADDASSSSVAPSDAPAGAPAPPALARVDTATPQDEASPRQVGEETLALDPESAQPDGATVAAPIATGAASRPAAVPTDAAAPETPARVITEAPAVADATPSAVETADAALTGLDTDSPPAEIALAAPSERNSTAEAESDAPAPLPEAGAIADAPAIAAESVTRSAELAAPSADAQPTASLAEAAPTADAQAPMQTDAPALGAIDLPGAIALDTPTPSDAGAADAAETTPDAPDAAMAEAREADAPTVAVESSPSALAAIAPTIETPPVALDSLAGLPTTPAESSAPSDAPSPSSTVPLELPGMDAVALAVPESRAAESREELDAPALAANSAQTERAPLRVEVDPAPLALAALAPDAEGAPDASLAPSSRATDLDSRRAPALAATTPVAPTRTPGTVEPNLAVPMEFAPPAEAYAQRDEEVREQTLEQLGGSEETEAAVADALAWLAAIQSENGAWDADEPGIDCDDCGGVTNIESDVALTGLALLCFLGADHTHISPGPYQDTVRRGLEWLVAQQQPDGDLRRRESMYSHGIAAIALAEAYGMTRDPALRDRVAGAVDFIIDARNRETGGWRYAPRQLGDTSVLGWQVMALVSARRSGVDVPDAIMEVAADWLDLVDLRSRPGLYAYQPGERPTFAMTAEGLFVRQLLGDRPDEEHMRNSVDFVMEETPDWERDANTYGWYYATLALFQHQGEAWREWNEAISAELLERQVQGGPMAGSWAPADRWSLIGGRIYQTAICTLTLEVYYRYLPQFLLPAEEVE